MSLSDELKNTPFYDLPKAKQQEILNSAALDPPDGEVSNFDDPSNRNYAAYTVLVVCLGLAMGVLIPRIWTKIKTRQMRSQDYVALLALAAFMGFAVPLIQLAINPGFYVHTWNVRVGDLSPALYDLHVGLIVFGVVMLLIKAAILLEWIFLFVPRKSHNTFYWTCQSMLVLNCGFYIAFILVEVFRCSPMKRIWNRFIPGTCIDYFAVEVSASCFNFVSDLVILLLPQKIIWRLHMSTRKKLGASAIFAFGLLACACTALRLVGIVSWTNSEDTVYDIAEVGIWHLPEMMCGFLVFSVPYLPKAFHESITLQKLLVKMRVKGSAQIISSQVDPRSSQVQISGDGTPYRFGSKTSTSSLVDHNDLTLRDLGQGILRTTEITVQKERKRATKTVTEVDEEHMAQHPWIVLKDVGQGG